MQRQTTSRSGIDLVQSNGYMTAHVMHGQGRQQDALAAADRQRALRAAGLTHDTAQRTSKVSRVCTTFGAALIRFGTRLQATGTPSAHASR